MTKIVFLGVVAAWAAVLLPPLLRSRGDNRPGSSVSDFNRQLSSLQRSVPTRGMAPMRSMARPLAQSPMTRPVAAGHRGSGSQSNVDTSFVARQQMHAGTTQRPAHRRVHGEPGAVVETFTPELSRREAARPVATRRTITNREETRRRRANILFMLVMASVATLFLAATTHAKPMMYSFLVSSVALCCYCYKLIQLRQVEREKQYGEQAWFRAA